jgi:hypothetical protein
MAEKGNSIDLILKIESKFTDTELPSMRMATLISRYPSEQRYSLMNLHAHFIDIQ